MGKIEDLAKDMTSNPISILAPFIMLGVLIVSVVGAAGHFIYTNWPAILAWCKPKLNWAKENAILAKEKIVSEYDKYKASQVVSEVSEQPKE